MVCPLDRYAIPNQKGGFVDRPHLPNKHEWAGGLSATSRRRRKFYVYQRLLDFDRCTGLFELLFHILGFVLANRVLDVDRCAFHQVLGFLESQ